MHKEVIGNVEDIETPDHHARNQDDTPDGTSNDLIPKLLIAPIAIIIATMLIGLPVLRIISTNDNDDSMRLQAAAEARQQVALLFSSAALESRSINIAERYAVADVHAQVNTLVADLRRRDPEELRNAVSTTERVTCRSPVEDNECFVSRLARPGEESLAEIRFTVGIVGGSARVVAIQSNRQALLS
jgi:hypothetical protein